MLGKLTRWLRIMGYDVKYSTKLDDCEIIKIIEEENRILLTSDLALYQRTISKNLPAYNVKGTNETERLAEITQHFNLPVDIDLEKTRCPKCNAKLQVTNKLEILEEIKPNTLKYYTTFWKCPFCNAIYWQGAHWNNIRIRLEQIKEKIKEKKEKNLLA